MYLVTLYKNTFVSQKVEETHKFTCEERARECFRKMKLEHPGKTVTFRQTDS